jgi:hypothetical protein
VLVDSRVDGTGGEYTESFVASRPVVAGHRLMGRLLDRL